MKMPYLSSLFKHFYTFNIEWSCSDFVQKSNFYFPTYKRNNELFVRYENKTIYKIRYWPGAVPFFLYFLLRSRPIFKTKG